MDQGLAALIAGLAGAIGGIGGGAAGAYFTGRAMVRQVNGEAVTEHGHWIREQRMEAHLQYLGAWDAATRGVGDKRHDALELVAADREGRLRQDPEEAATRIAVELYEMVDGSRERLDPVSLLGPPEVSGAAVQLHQVLTQLRDEAMTHLGALDLRGSDESVMPHSDALAQAREARYAYLVAVRDLLDKPPRA